jgi:nucleoside 2-deoxyribosyltransferase
MKVYVAAALFSQADIEYNKMVAQRLREQGFDVYLPQEKEQGADKKGFAWRIFSRNLRHLDECDVMLARLDGTGIDSGVAWECAYYFAKGKPVVAFRTDFRKVSEEEGANLQVEQGLSQYYSTLDECIAFMAQAKRTLEYEASHPRKARPWLRINV